MQQYYKLIMPSKLRIIFKEGNGNIELTRRRPWVFITAINYFDKIASKIYHIDRLRMMIYLLKLY